MSCLGGAILIVVLFEKLGFDGLELQGGLEGSDAHFPRSRQISDLTMGLGGGVRGGDRCHPPSVKKRPHLLTLLSLLTCFRNIASKATMNVAIGAIQHVRGAVQSNYAELMANDTAASGCKFKGKSDMHKSDHLEGTAYVLNG